MVKICVNLYGGKPISSGREKTLEADIITCAKADTCSFYKQNKCLLCRNSLGVSYCPYGAVKTVKGCTSRSKKYNSFKEQYTSDETYAKLEYPFSERFGVVGDYAIFTLGYFGYRKITEKRQGYQCFYINEKGYTKTKDSTVTCIALKDLDVEFLNEIFKLCTHRLYLCNHSISR